MVTKTLSCVLVLCALLCAITASAAPKDGKAPAKKPAAVSDFKQQRQWLESTDRAQVRAALQAFQSAPSPRMIEPVSARLREGLPPDLSALAIEVLATSGRPQAGKVLVELLEHRRADTRRAAVTALATLRARAAAGQVVAALDDPDPGVRDAAVDALGALGGSRALNHLYAALERGQAHAISAIARLSRPADLSRLFEYAQGRPFSALEPALNELLARKDFPLRGKLSVVAKLGEVGTQPAQNYLRQYLTRLPDASKKRLMRAVGEALQQAQQGQP